MKLILQVTADTTAYMIAGYLFIFVAMLIYTGSLVIRWRKLMQEFNSLQKRRNA